MKSSNRSLFLFLTLLVAAALAFSAQAAKKKKSAASTTAFSPSVTTTTSSMPNCSLPGVQVLSDPSNDQLGNQASTNQQLDFTAVYFAELGTDSQTLTITMKVQNLSGTLTLNATWQVYMNVKDTNGTLRTIFVNMNTTDNPPNAAFNFGYNSSLGGTGNDTSQGTPGVVSGSFATDGTITIKLNTANVISFNDISQAHQFDVDLRQPGVSLSGINAVTTLLVGVVGNGVTTTIDDSSNATGTESYLTIGNAACAGATPTPTPTPTPTGTPTPTPTTTPATGIPRFFTYLSPQGVGDSAGEPSIGSNWTREATDHNTNVNGSTNDILNGGTSLYMGGFLSAMVKVTWDDCSSPAGALWENKPLLSANTPRAFGDPILFTDHDTGRTFCGQLEGLTPAGCTIDITDNDGDMFIPSDGVIPSDVDHETIGGGHYHSPLPNPGPVYQNAIYYASQSIAEARCLRSDDGGITFSQGTTPMFEITDCSGLHGHVKVSPADGTVYVPDKGCGGDVVNFHEGSKQTLVVSQDNGITWTLSEIPDSTSHGENQASHDPSVGVATDGTVYLGYQDAGGHPKIAVSHDKGATWSASYDVGANVINGGPVLNCAFPAVVAGDPNRAAFEFFGSETGGDNWHCGNGEDCSPEPPFPGVWYLYVATTFDGGQTWTTQNITPGDPIQRSGICGGGTCRNLLDFFDATIDKEGRVVIGYDDGCISAGCIAGDPSITAGGGQNDYTAKGYIARQSGGPRMFAVFDPVEPALPGAPEVSGGLNAAGDTANLSWPVPDNGGSAITAYKVYRQVGGSGSYNLIATVPVPNYTDTGLTPGTQYCYHVTAINGIGEGPYCPNFCPTVVVVPNPCKLPGVLAVTDLNPDGSDNDSGANTPPDPRVNIREQFVAEPFFGAGVEKLVFTMQLAPSTAGSPPASSQWYIIWNRQGTDSSDPNDANYDRIYVAMKTDVTGALSFDYGKFGVPLDATNPNPQANTPTSFGSDDSGTYDVASGVVTIIISNSKLRAIDGGASKYVAGTSLGAINVRTYLARPDAGQKSQNNASDITGNGAYTLVGNASCATTVPVVGAASRKTHGTAGTFDIGLPLTGNPGIECRNGGSNGNYTVVFVFANPITSVSGASTSAGSVSSRMVNPAEPHEYLVNLTGVSNAQRVTVTLTGITDTAGNATPSLAVTMGVLIGDTSADGFVDSADIAQTKSQSGNGVTVLNFREDVNADGFVDSADIALVKSKSGTALP